MIFPCSQATPPSSGHRRGESSVETVLGSTEFYHREPHREGAPAPLCYYPGIHRPVESSDRLATDWETILRPKVVNAMEEYDISPQAITPIHQLGAPSSPVKGGETILISAPSHKHRNNNWFLAISDIRRFFASVGWADLIVEISDFKEMNLRTWAIREGEPIVEQWADIREVLLKQLAVDEAANLESISIFRRGKSNERTGCPFTIVLTVPEVYGLMIIKDQIRHTLDSYGYDDIGLEIIRDRLAITRNSIAHIDPSNKDNYQLGGGTGVSIGPKGCSESGTLGGYICLRLASGRRIQLGLTCYHVVRPGIPKTWRKFCDSNGISPASEISGTVTLTQPSRANHNDIVEVRESYIAAANRGIEEDTSRLSDMEMKILHGIKSEDHVRPIHSALKANKSNHLKMSQLLSSSKEFYSQTSHFGHIFAASGYRRSAEKHQLDWALIELDETRKPPNLKIPTHDDKGEWLTSYSTLYKPSCPPVLKSPVWKKGRTTSFTRGIISHIKTDVYPDGMASKQASTEWVIVSEEAAPATFSLRGDSGAMVLNHQSDLVGMLVGGFEATRFSYMTPYAALVADIERQTGAKVEIEEH